MRKDKEKRRREERQADENLIKRWAVEVEEQKESQARRQQENREKFEKIKIYNKEQKRVKLE